MVGSTLAPAQGGSHLLEMEGESEREVVSESETSRAQRGERERHHASALSVIDQDYLKQAFCGFLKAKEGVEMEHLGVSLLLDVLSM